MNLMNVNGKTTSSPKKKRNGNGVPHHPRALLNARPVRRPRRGRGGPSRNGSAVGRGPLTVVHVEPSYAPMKKPETCHRRGESALDPHPNGFPTPSYAHMRLSGGQAKADACALPGEKPNVADVALARRETGVEYFGGAHAAP